MKGRDLCESQNAYLVAVLSQNKSQLIFPLQILILPRYRLKFLAFLENGGIPIFKPIVPERKSRCPRLYQDPSLSMIQEIKRKQTNHCIYTTAYVDKWL